MNKRNDRWLCSDAEEVPVVMSTKLAASLVVLGVISNESDVMLPLFLEQGLRVNVDAYIHVTDTWMEGFAGKGHKSSSTTEHKLTPTKRNHGWRKTRRSSGQKLSAP